MDAKKSDGPLILKKTSQECETALTSQFDSLEKKVEQVEKS